MKTARFGIARRLLALVFALVALPGCGDLVSGKGVAEPEVTRFHERLTAREFEAIYASASDDFRKAAPKEKFLALLAAIDRKLGAMKSTKQVSWNVRRFNFKTTAVLGYKTTFEGGEATETFTFRIADGKPELLGYNISSMELMTK